MQNKANIIRFMRLGLKVCFAVCTPVENTLYFSASSKVVFKNNVINLRKLF